MSAATSLLEDLVSQLEKESDFRGVRTVVDLIRAADDASGDGPMSAKRLEERQAFAELQAEIASLAALPSRQGAAG